MELQENWDIQVPKPVTELTPIQAYYVGIGPENREMSKLSKVLSKDCIMDSLCKVHVS